MRKTRWRVVLPRYPESLLFFTPLPLDPFLDGEAGEGIG